MAEMTTVWLAEFDAANKPVVRCYEARVTAKQARVVFPGASGQRETTRLYDIDKLRFSRDEALAKLRREAQQNLAFAQSKVEEAAEQLVNLNAFEGIP